MVSRLACLAALAMLVTSGCSGHGHAVSRNADGSCLRAWNAAGNAANREFAVSTAQAWRVEVTHSMVDHPAPGSTGRGCSYLFFNSKRWMTFGGTWQANGDLRWAQPPSGTKARFPEQRFLGPTSTVNSDGMIVAHPSARWRDLFVDWFVDGHINGRWSCKTAREAVAHLPMDGPNAGTAIRAYARRVC
jgi:hypothetical protein